MGDTLRLHARALDRGGDTIPGAVVTLAVLDTFLTLDSADFAVIGRATTLAARVVARSGALRSDPFAIRVPVGHADSLALSGVFAVTVLDLTTTPDSAQPVADRPVRFVIVQPVFGSVDTATVGLANDSLGQTVRTAATGIATTTMHRRRGTQPDSVVIRATAVRSSGAALRGSPVTFVVRFP